MTARHGFSDPEWEMLLYVPYAVFFSVAWADGKLSPPESNTFAILAKNVGSTANRPQDALVRDVMHEVSVNFGPIGQRMNNAVGEGLSFAEILQSGRNLLDTKADALQGAVFKNTMIQLAERVAEAWPLFGRKTSPEEHKSIQMIKAHLGVARLGDSFLPFGT